MNKQIILQALRRQLKTLEWQLYFDKAQAAKYWERSDKSKPVETAEDYLTYKSYKNLVRNDQRKLRTIRETIRAVKAL